MFMLQGDKEMLDEHYYQLKIEQWYVVIFIRAYNHLIDRNENYIK